MFIPDENRTADRDISALRQNNAQVLPPWFDMGVLGTVSCTLTRRQIDRPRNHEGTLRVTIDLLTT